MQWWLFQKLKSRKAENRLEAVQTLGSAESPKNTDALIRSLGDADGEIRLTALQALAKTRSETVLPPLRAMLGDPEPSVREAAIGALLSCNDHESIPQIVIALRDPHVSVRWRAAKVLEALGWSPTSNLERARHAVALGEYGQAALLGDVAIEPLAEALKDEHSHTRRGVLEALAQIDDTSVLRLLLESLKDRDSHVRVAAAEVLSDFPEPKVIEALTAHLSDQDALLRAAAATSLGRLGDATAIRPLIEALHDPDWSVRKAVVDALGLLRAPGAVEPLAELLSDADYDVRESVAVAYGRISDRRAIEWLVASLADGQLSVRQATAAALGRIDPDWQRSEEAKHAIPRLEAAMQHRDYWVRHAASAALNKFRESTEVEASLRQGHDQVVFRRQATIRTLLEALEDDDRDLRLAAVETLGRMQESAAAGPLRARLEDADQWVRAGAEAALRIIASQPVRAPSGGIAATLRNASRQQALRMP
jgi:HEAT repeat protein